MKRWSWLLKPTLLIGSLTGLVIFVYSQTQLQVGYAVVTADSGRNVPVGTALFSSTNAQGVLVWEAGVAAVEPISSGRIFVDQQGGSRTAVAIVNPSQESVAVTLILRNVSGTEVDRKDEPFDPGQHRSLFVDELFPSSQNFTGSLSFQTQQDEDKVAAVTLRQNTNLQGEPIFATLPVVDLSAEPNTESIILPQVGAGEGLSTQIVLINSSEEAINGQIQLFDSQGAALELELDQTTGSSFPYQIEPDGTFSGKLTSASVTAVGYAVVTLEEGSQTPTGTVIFQFTSGDSVLSEAGIAAVTPTTSARIFVDNVGTRTGVAIASAGNPSTTVTFQLRDLNGSSLQTMTRPLPAGGHLSIFADELFSEAAEGFTGLMEMTSPVPIAPVTLKLTTNGRGQSIVTTLPLVDLTRTVMGSSLFFPQIGFGDFEGGSFATRLILINQDQMSGATGRLHFFQSDGNALIIPQGFQTGSEFPYALPSGGGRQLQPGVAASSSVAEIIIEPSDPLTPEVVINEGNTRQLNPLALDEEGEALEGVNFSYTSLDTAVATVDAFGEIAGKQAGFSTLTVTAGGVVKTATITVVKVTSGVGFENVTAVVGDLAKRLYLANTQDHTILLAQNLETAPEVYAGVAQMPGLLNEERLQALFDNPAFLALDQARGSLYVSDGANHVIRKVDPGPNGKVETLAGTGEPGSRDGPAHEAHFNNPQGIALDSRGHLWVVDSGNHAIRRINLVTRRVETIAGMAGEPGLVDGTGEEARFNSPMGIALDRETPVEELERQRIQAPPPPITVVVADTNNGVIRRVVEDGKVETIGFETTSQQNTATASISFQREGIVFESPEGVGVDPFGNIYVAEPTNNRVRVILGAGPRRPTGGIGQGGGGVVPAAGPGTFDNPTGIAIPGSGEVVVVGGGRNRKINYGAPEIESVTPETIPYQAGETVTIRGRGFAPEAQVVIAGQVIEDLQILDTRTMQFIVSKISSGKNTLTVQTRGGVAQRSLTVEAIPLSALAPGEITTVAGGSTFVGDGSIGTQAKLDRPLGPYIDGEGNVLFADREQHRIRKVDVVTGIITTVAGTGTAGFSGDGGPALTADLDQPEGVAVDSAGNLYIVDSSNFRVRKVDASTGIITTVAGRSDFNFSGDGGPATEAALFFPGGVAVDGAGNFFISDTFNHRIRRVDGATGIITTVAGSGPTGFGNGGFSGDGGPAAAATLFSPGDLALDRAGNLFIADRSNTRIRKVDVVTGIITTVAGTGTAGFSGDGGPALTADLNQPGGVAVDSAGNLYIADSSNLRVRKVDAATGIITTTAGNGEVDFPGDGGLAAEAALTDPEGVAVDGAGNLFITQRGVVFGSVERGTAIRRVDGTTGIISTVAGNDEVDFLGDGGPAIAAAVAPQDVTVDGAGNLLIADFNRRIRKVDGATGIISSVAGGGTDFLSDDIPATEVDIAPTSVLVDETGNLFIGTPGTVRKVDAATGLITTVVGTVNAGVGFSGDSGLATEAVLNRVAGIAIDEFGNLWIADSENHRIRKVDASTGIITTVAGSGPTGFANGGFSGDGGPATAATLNLPLGVALDSAGNLFIADHFNARVRRVDASTGLITTVAEFIDSPPFIYPAAVAVDPADDLFIARLSPFIPFSSQVLKLHISTNTMTTVAGAFTEGSLFDGVPATEAALKTVFAMVLDQTGNLFITDSSTSRVRVVRGPIP